MAKWYKTYKTCEHPGCRNDKSNVNGAKYCSKHWTQSQRDGYTTEPDIKIVHNKGKRVIKSSRGL